MRIAVVGGGTGEILERCGLRPEFTATKSTGATLGGELPKVPGGHDTVLYPASCRASQELQGSLAASGFAVTRLNTYDTRGITQVGAAGDAEGRLPSLSLDHLPHQQQSFSNDCIFLLHLTSSESTMTYVQARPQAVRLAALLPLCTTLTCNQ